MASRIKVGEKVIGTTGYGRWGSRQIVGRLEKILDKPDQDGNKYIIELPARYVMLGGKSSIRCISVRRA